MTRRGPLAGLQIVVTRRASQASALSARLRELGATPVEVSTIALAAPTDGGAALHAAIESLTSFDRIAVASPNGARALLAASSGAVGPLPPVACVGPSTAAVFDDGPFVVDVVPDRAVAEGLVDAVGDAPRDNARLLLVQAEVARTVLADGLRGLGWHVDRVVAYRTVDGAVTDADVAAARRADAITFTSSSTVERFLRLAGSDAVPPAVVSIGPVTSATARELGLQVTVEADPHTIDGLVDAVVDWARTLTPRRG